MREPNDEVNDPDRVAAICWTCNERKTPKDLKEIARAKRLADKHQDFLEGQRYKVPGRKVHRHASSRKGLALEVHDHRLSGVFATAFES